MKCFDCRFWVHGSGPEDPFEVPGECRRHAPRPNLISSDDPGFRDRDAVWPHTYHTAFCGEFVAKVEKRVSFV